MSYYFLSEEEVEKCKEAADIFASVLIWRIVKILFWLFLGFPFFLVLFSVLLDKS